MTWSLNTDRRIGMISIAAALTDVPAGGSSVGFERQCDHDDSLPPVVRRSRDEAALGTFNDIGADARGCWWGHGGSDSRAAHNEGHSAVEGGLEVYFVPQPRADLEVQFAGVKLEDDQDSNSLDIMGVRVDMNREEYDADAVVLEEAWFQSARTHTHEWENFIAEAAFGGRCLNGRRCIQTDMDNDGGEDDRAFGFPLTGYGLNDGEEFPSLVPDGLGDDSFRIESSHALETIQHGGERGLGWAGFHVSDGRDHDYRVLREKGYGFRIEVEAQRRVSHLPMGWGSARAVSAASACQLPVFATLHDRMNPPGGSSWGFHRGVVSRPSRSGPTRIRVCIENFRSFTDESGNIKKVQYARL